MKSSLSVATILVVCVSLPSVSKGLPLPLAHWKFDETSGQALADSAGNDHPAQRGRDAGTDADPEFTSSGLFDGALSFDGGDVVFTDDSLADPSLIPATGAFSVMGWINTDISHNGALVSQATSTSNDHVILYGTRGSSGNVARIYTGSQLLVSQSETNDGVWHHIAWTRSGDLHRLYVDGILEGGPATRALSIQQSSNTAIGEGNPAAFGFQGKIDDVAIFLDDVSPSEMAVIHGAGRLAGAALDDPAIDDLWDLVQSDGANSPVEAGGKTWYYRDDLADHLGPSGEVGMTGTLADGAEFIVVTSSGEGVATSPVPEPATCLVAVIGAAILCIWQLRMWQLQRIAPWRSF